MSFNWLLRFILLVTVLLLLGCAAFSPDRHQGIFISTNFGFFRVEIIHNFRFKGDAIKNYDNNVECHTVNTLIKEKLY